MIFSSLFRRMIINFKLPYTVKTFQIIHFQPFKRLRDGSGMRRSWRDLRNLAGRRLALADKYSLVEWERHSRIIADSPTLSDFFHRRAHT